MKNPKNEYVIPVAGATDIYSNSDYKSYHDVLQKYPFSVYVKNPNFDAIDQWLTGKPCVRFGYDNWLFFFTCEKDKVKFILRWA